MANTTTTFGALKNAIKRIIAAASCDQVFITIDKEGCTIEGKDPKGISGYAKAQVTTNSLGGSGTGCITADHVNAILGNESADAEITIVPSDDGLIMRFAGSRLKIKRPETSNTALFNDVREKHTVSHLFTTSGADLKDAFYSATKFAAKREIRPFMCGIHLDNSSDKLVVTGTDGYMMHLLNSNIDLTPGAKLDIILPNDAAKAAAGNVFAANELVSVSLLGRNLVEFKTEDMTWVCNLIADKFPSESIAMLLKGEANSADSVVIKQSEVLVALNRVHAISEDKYLDVEFNDGKFFVRSKDGEQVGSFACETTGTASTFSLMSTLAINTFGAMPSSEFVLMKDGADPQSKIYLRPIKDAEKDMSWIALLMPARA